MIKHSCPDCGDDRHLYRIDPVDISWDPDACEWVTIENDNDAVECTSCDWNGRIAETEEAEVQ